MRSSRWLFRAFVSLLVVFVVLHLLAYLVFSTDDFKAWEQNRDSEFFSTFWFYKYKPHPYFGYYNPETLPSLLYEKNNNDYVIAITGGSFAGTIVDFLNSPERTSFREQFQDTIPPGKTLKFINLTAGGYHQPVAYLQVSLYSDIVDAVISIEGFNELFADHNYCSPAGWPSLYVYGFKNYNYNFLAAIQDKAKDAYTAIDRWRSDGPFTSNINRLLSYTIGKTLQKVIISIEKKNDDTVAKRTCSEFPRPEDKHYRLHLWDKYLKKLGELASQKQIPLVVIFQPNLHDQGSKPLSPQEVEWVNSISSSGRKSSEYKYAVDYFLNKNYSFFYDYTQLYSDKKETLYMDSCCHVNTEGRKLFVEKLISDFASAIKSTASKK